MKRSYISRGKKGFKKKRSKLRKKSKQKISVLKRKLWEQFAKYIKARDKNLCFTCGRAGTGSGMHCGHFIPKSVGGLLLYFNEENCHAQCYNCNINLSGNQWVYGQKLGEEKVKKLYLLKKQTTKWSSEDFLLKIAQYTKLNDNSTTKK